ncbi:MAG TPA: hypothetical protein VMT00_03315 [Thermoanaerobaculia bacterium]|nr:hypothetical protein [Thermoanaerobaculia bacterium]
MRTLLILALVFGTVGCRDIATEERIKQIEDRVAALEQRGSSSAAPAVATPSSASAPSQTATSQSAVQPTGGVPGQDPAAAEAVLIAHCTEKWPSDFNLRAYCQKQQREAVAKLNQPPPADIPADAMAVIRSKCAEKWPTDYNMRGYCENQQFEGYREANR